MQSFNTRTFLQAARKDLPILFVYIGWAERYNGSEPIRGNFEWVKDNPEDNGEMYAFRPKRGVYTCTIGKGQLNDEYAHVIFVARPPGEKHRVAVAVYANARIAMFPNLWATASTKQALLIPTNLRPAVTFWPGSQGMRRWARRPSDQNGTSHKRLESFYFNLLTKIEKGKLKARLRSSPYADLELSSFTEGRMRQQFIKHRSREYRLRDAKVTSVIQKTGALRCEVPRCGFDYAETYGEIGVGYIHVHHKNPLSKAAFKGTTNSIDDLAVVCANCHAMIHRHGKSRPLSQLRIRRRKTQK